MWDRRADRAGPAGDPGAVYGLTARCSKLYLAVGRTSGACSSAGGRRSSMRGWRWWILRTACSLCSWIGRVKAIPSCIMASWCNTPELPHRAAKQGPQLYRPFGYRGAAARLRPVGGGLSGMLQRHFCLCRLGRSGRARCFYGVDRCGVKRCFTCRRGQPAVWQRDQDPCWPTRPCRPGWTPTAWPKCCCLVPAVRRGAGCSKISGSCCPASAPW